MANEGFSSNMITHVVYKFTSAPQANRFLNELQHWSLHEVKAKLYKQSSEVGVSYEYETKGFDYTSSDLDDLARTYGGQEI